MPENCILAVTERFIKLRKWSAMQTGIISIIFTGKLSGIRSLMKKECPESKRRKLKKRKKYVDKIWMLY